MRSSVAYLLNVPHRDEQISLVGGLSQTGHPAELVRIKDGKSISLRTGEVTDLEKIASDFHPSLKRSGSEELDEDTLRSMARRRKSAQPQIKDVQKCRECEKIFKRPCDLTYAIPKDSNTITNICIVNMKRRTHDLGSVTNLAANIMNMDGQQKRNVTVI